MTVRTAIALFVILQGDPARAQQFQDHAKIDAAVIAATGVSTGQTGGAAGPVDRRLKLANCPVALQTDAPVMGAIAVRCSPLGWRIRVPLIAKQPATQIAEALDIVVKRGESVELRALGPGFEVSSSAIAMDDGALGKGIRVKSLTSTTPIVATVAGPALVQISR
jgi:flagellar basal body P-ring formation protein FlgA